MRTTTLTLIAGVLLGMSCAGDSPPPNNSCSGAAYDPCNDEHDCTSALCHNFMAEGFQVCTQMCDASNPCPGDGVCNAMGICKPSAANTCTL